MDLPKQIQKRFDLIDDQIEIYYEEKNHKKIIELELEKWDILPNIKEDFDESFFIAKSLVDEYTQLKNEIETSKWIKLLFLCDKERIDDGEREFIAGKSFFEFNEFQKAYDEFKIAFHKSEGRSFKDEDPKYLEFYRNPEKYLK